MKDDLCGRGRDGLARLLNGAGTPCPPLVALVTGASGAGKSHLVEEMERRFSGEPRVGFRYFDCAGVPSAKEMEEQYGSGERWQEATTVEWVRQIAATEGKAVVVFEGSYRPEFALRACREHGVKRVLLVVVDVADDIRVDRLTRLRKQPELADEHMMNWARFLRNDTIARGGSVIDTSSSDVGRSVDDLCDLILRAFPGQE